MTPRFTFRPRARHEAHSPGLGLEFARALDATFAAILERPEAFGRLRGDPRQALVRRFPYSVLFVYEGGEVHGPCTTTAATRVAGQSRA